jgi:taurine dioxygenase
MAISVVRTKQACGAHVRGVDLTQPLVPEEVRQIRSAWLEHHVLAFPGQEMSDDDLERFTLYFGPFGADPFIAPIKGREHVIAVARAADETASIFAEAWHTDWSFQERPPAGTCLFAVTIPPAGGDTLFANQHMALEAMPAELRAKIEGKNAVHSAKVAYGPDGIYGAGDAEAQRAMRILCSSEAEQVQSHPLIRVHPESGRPGLFGCAGYIYAIENLGPDEAWALLTELYQWQTRPEFQYRHVWEEGMLVMWDNRSVLHMATAGYDGFERVLHRTTIGAGGTAQSM